MPNPARQVTKKQVIDALEYFLAHPDEINTSYNFYELIYKEVRFSPKAVVRKAAQMAGIRFSESNFSGGSSTNKPLERLGFTIETKSNSLTKDAHATKYFAVGATWRDKGVSHDQTERFLEEGIWINANGDERCSDLTQTANPGDYIAIKSSFQKDGVSYLRVKGIGVIQKNRQDGERLDVEWRQSFEPFDIPNLGYYRTTIQEVQKEEDVRKIFFSEQEQRSEFINKAPEVLVHCQLSLCVLV